MVDNTALATAMASLAAAIRSMPAAAINPKVYDPFKSEDPFDLSSRSGSMAYDRISAPLDDTWDGDVTKFPSFVTELRIRAAEGKWNLATDPGILTIGAKDILTDYHSISDADIETARLARTSDRALQNSTAMFMCIKSSIKGTLKDTIFNQFGNILTHTDGVSLFKQITSFSTVASIQLSMLSFQNILNFDVAAYDYSIPTINSKLCNLFTLATSSTRSLAESERVQHTLSAYSKILQPDTWARWVGTKVDLFEEGKTTKCQDFMNLATMKYNKIVNVSGKFHGSTKTVQEDIIAMLAHKESAKRKRPSVPDDDDHSPPTHKFRRDPPPFLIHFQTSDKVKYKVGDKKEHAGSIFYFCDCPLHRNKLKWHTHHPDKCRLRNKWIKEKATDTPSPDASAHILVENEAYENTSTITDDTTDQSTTTTTGSDVQALLASAMNLCGDNDVLRDSIADAINNASAM